MASTAIVNVASAQEQAASESVPVRAIASGTTAPRYSSTPHTPPPTGSRNSSTVPASALPPPPPGGIITSGALRGAYFGEGGTPGQLNYGLVGGNFMQGGQWQDADYSTTASLAPKSERGNVFGRLSYALTDHFEVFAQASYAESNSRGSVGSLQKDRCGIRIHVLSLLVSSPAAPST